MTSVRQRRSDVVTDVEILERLAARDEAALELLFERYGGPCFGLARRIIGDEALAQDVVQEVFLACWNGAGYDPTRGAVRSWLMSVTHHKAVDLVRREERRRARRAPEDALRLLAATTDSPEEGAWQLLRKDAVRAALHELPSDQREVLLLAYFGGYSQREISALIGIPLGTVKTRTLAAMRRLRAALATSVQADDLEQSREVR
jgi:RNA polymerase sigma-70 factor (ECF subfamily)